MRSSRRPRLMAPRSVFFRAGPMHSPGLGPAYLPLISPGLRRPLLLLQLRRNQVTCPRRSRSLTGSAAWPFFFSQTCSLHPSQPRCVSKVSTTVGYSAIFTNTSQEPAIRHRPSYEQRQRNNLTQHCQPFLHQPCRLSTSTMFESSLSSTRATLGHFVSATRFSQSRFSSWLATAAVEDYKPRYFPEDNQASTTTTTTTTERADPLRSQKPQQETTTTLDFKASIPAKSWDSHMHVLDPRFPLSPEAVYTPSPTAPTTLRHVSSFEADVGLENIVLVQPSIYGYDNNCLLDALRALGPRRARGVVAFEDPALWVDKQAISIPYSSFSSFSSSSTSLSSTSENQMSTNVLKEWHSLGVRGVRINLQSLGQKDVSPADFRALLRRYIEVVKPFGWVVQIYVAMDMVHILEPLVEEYKAAKQDEGVKLCIDHMGHPHLKQLEGYRATRDPYTIPGFASLVGLLRSGMVYVKLSAAYRFSAEMSKTGGAEGIDTASKDVWPIARELLRVAGESRVVFATDWPHTRFDGLDIRPWMQSVVDMCEGDERLVERVFRSNAEELWSVTRDEDN